ncbi:hypothetical protein BOO69_08385 [Sulfitobacter alexandrii]|uniref:Tetratricopeptide repeat protein n=1 Tax=Sulfitobacter alexandrii TaxID=1917485 RepID=A0A1J0WGJ3_9RHOB|nr:hypothetical protein BOO69_08385 [Sulfitobacter alexandrii]
MLFGAAKESAQLGRHGDEFSVTLHYQNKAVPARAQVFGEGEVLDGKDGKGVEIVVPLTEAADGPLCSVICDLPEWLSLSPEAQAFLSDIFPTDNKAYEAVFLRKIHRYGDEALQYFVARQLSESFTGMRAYRVGAAVVMTYKSIELNDTDLQKEALDHVKMQLSHVGECEITNHPRTNREHLEVSLLCAQWHLELSLRRYDEFFSTLERCRSVAEGITNFFTPAYNLSMALLIYCALLARRGDVEKASEVADEGMRIFKSAVASATQQLTLFQELRISHRNVHLMLCTTKPDKRADADFNLYVQCSLRVTGDAVERLKKAAFDIYPVQEAGRS